MFKEVIFRKLYNLYKQPFGGIQSILRTGLSFLGCSENWEFCDRMKAFLSCIAALRNDKKTNNGCKRTIF
jgi:hypothetical protein